MLDKSNDENLAKLKKEDLVDEELSDSKLKDALRREQTVTHLKKLIETVKAPTNIALYGPWGSGKTTIGRLLEEKIRGTNLLGDSSISTAFIRFDAFKYADLSLRRSFIKVAVKELGKEGILSKKNGKEIVEKLNKEYETTGLFITSKKVSKILTFTALNIVLIYLAIKWSIPEHQIRKIIPLVTSFNVNIVSLFSFLVPLVVVFLKVKKSTSAPKEDDEFEEIFKEIINNIEIEKLVVFVDELDRCSSAEMVKTLDSIRTFFDVEKCVIVIAADRNVLETALETENSEATPKDSDNPYYSTGGAYLDKVFRYQINIPPFWQSQGIDYAFELIMEKEDGLWGEIKERDKSLVSEVLKILIPEYVISPRRVKNLLNSFVQLYRISEAKNLITIDRENIKTVARLACLQVEFPNFARDMLKNSDLPNHVLSLCADPTVTIEDIDIEAFEIAKAYAEQRRSTVKIISGPPGQTRENGEINEKHSKHLVRYLQKTESVKCPPFSLLYLDPEVKDSYGLSALMASDFLSLAQNNDVNNFLFKLGNIYQEKQARVLQHLVDSIPSKVIVNDNNVLKIIFSYFSDLLYGESFTEQYRISFIENIISLLTSVEGNLLTSDNIRYIWWACNETDARQASLLRSLLVNQCSLLPNLSIDDIDFMLDDIALMCTASKEGASQIFARMLLSRNCLYMIERLYREDDSVLAEILPPVIYMVAANENIEVASEVLQKITEFEIRKDRGMNEVILSQLARIDFRKSRESFNMIFDSGVKSSDARVLSYVFENILRVPSSRQSMWMRHIILSSKNKINERLLTKLYVNFMTDLEQINRPDFAEMEELIYSFVDMILDDENKSKVKQVIERENLNEDIQDNLANVKTVRKYQVILVKRGILSSTEYVDNLFVRVNGAIRKTKQGIMDVAELSQILEEYLTEDDFDILKMGFNGRQIRTLLYELMRCDVLEPSSRFLFINILSDAIPSIKEGRDELPSVARIEHLLVRYGGLAVKPALAWLRWHNNPEATANIFHTLISERLSAGNGYAEAFYRDWKADSMVTFWGECFNRVEPHVRPMELVETFALNKVATEDKDALFGWLIHTFNQYEGIRSRDLILGLLKSANISNKAPQVRDYIIFPLLDRHLKSESGDFPAVLLGIRSVEQLLPKDFVGGDLELRDYLRKVLNKTPELWMPIERIIYPV